MPLSHTSSDKYSRSTASGVLKIEQQRFLTEKLDDAAILGAGVCLRASVVFFSPALALKKRCYMYHTYICV